MTSSLDIARIVDLVIVMTVIELAALALYRRATGKGIPLVDFVPNVLSGLALMFALRSAVVDVGRVWIVCWLLAAGAVHATDIALRWRRVSRTEPSRRFIASKFFVRKSAT